MFHRKSKLIPKDSDKKSNSAELHGSHAVERINSATPAPILVLDNPTTITNYEMVLFQTPEISHNISKRLSEQEKLNFRLVCQTHRDRFVNFSKMDYSVIKMKLLKKKLSIQIEQQAKQLNLLDPADKFDNQTITKIQKILYIPYFSPGSITIYGLSAMMSFVCGPLAMATSLQTFTNDEEKTDEYQGTAYLLGAVTALTMGAIAKRFNHDKKIANELAKLTTMIDQYNDLVKKIKMAKLNLSRLSSENIPNSDSDEETNRFQHLARPF